MSKPTLYLMLGYPGAGKTTTAKVISILARAELIWEDEMRKELFPGLTFSGKENLDLHNHLNNLTAKLLKQGKSVVYDTSFNRFKDRARMYEIALNANADTRLVWIKTDRKTAHKRATQNASAQPTRPLAKVLGDMDDSTFHRLADKLEPPYENESYITFDGTKITSDYVKETLGL